MMLVARNKLRVARSLLRATSCAGVNAASGYVSSGTLNSTHSITHFQFVNKLLFNEEQK